MAPPPPPIRACLFDMDGLLIDSEEIYTIVTNEILARYGKPGLPWAIKAQMQGRPGPESAKIFHAWAGLPISADEFYEAQKPLQERYFPSSQPLPGADDLLKSFERTSPKVYIALATSSHRRNYELKTDHLRGLMSAFEEQHVVLGDDERIPKGRGKPAPDIYLLALKTINDRLRKEGGKEILPEECLVFEDSVPGVEAGRRAGMQVVWVPHEGLLKVYRGREKEVLAGLTGEGLTEEKAYGQSEADVEARYDVPGQNGNKTKVAGAPGEIDDGWGKQYASLENFPFKDYGINVQS